MRKVYCLYIAALSACKQLPVSAIMATPLIEHYRLSGTMHHPSSTGYATLLKILPGRSIAQAAFADVIVAVDGLPGD